MARPALPLDESLGGEIYNILLEFVDKEEAIPNAHAFWKQILVGERGYALSRSGFDYWWRQLRLDGLITIEPKTKAIRVKDVRVKVTG